MHTIPSINADDFKIENQKGIDNHKTAAEHLQAAAKYYLEAAKQEEAGSLGKARQNVIIAMGFTHLAAMAQHEDSRHHATYN